MRPFGCPVTILNKLDSLGKFDGKGDEGFLVGYSVSSIAFRVFNSRSRIVQETLHVNFLENKPNVAGSRPTWLFDIDTLTKTMNYQPVTAYNQSNPSACNIDEDATFDEKEPEFDENKPESKVNVYPSSSAQSKKEDDKTKREAKGKSPVESFIRYRNLSAEFKDFSDNSFTIGQISSNSTNTFSVNNDLNQFCGMKGIKKEFSVPRTPQQNGIAERKNQTLIKAARTMLADSLLPIPFWAEAVNTACKFDRKVDDGFLVRYSVSSKAFRVFTCRTRIVQDTLHINFLENNPNVAGSGPTWLFDIDTLTKTMNYQPVTTGNQSNPSAGIQEQFDTEKAREENVQQYVLFPVWSSGSTNPHNTNGNAAFEVKKHDDKTKREAKGKSPVESSTGYRNLSAEFEDFSDKSINEDSVAGSLVPTVGQITSNNTNTFSAVGPSNTATLLIPDDEEDVGAEAEFTNLETMITVSPIPTTRVHKDHHVIQIIGDLSSATQTRSMTRVAKDQGGLSQINNDDFHTRMFACFLSQEEPKRVPNIRHLKPFGCQVTILNTSDHLGKFEGKANDGFLVGYAAHSKAYRVYNLTSKKVEETLNLRYLEDKPNVQGTHDTNILAGTTTDDSDSECDEQVILVPSFPSNCFLGPTVQDVSALMKNNLDYAEELARLQRQEYEAHSVAAKHGFEFSIDTAALLPQANIEIHRNLVPAAGDPAGGIVHTGGVPAGSDPAGGIVPTGGDLADSCDTREILKF
nr:hypothetical protein [Tanacetum cinerariifolium]